MSVWLPYLGLLVIGAVVPHLHPPVWLLRLWMKWLFRNDG